MQCKGAINVDDMCSSHKMSNSELPTLLDLGDVGVQAVAGTLPHRMAASGSLLY